MNKLKLAGIFMVAALVLVAAASGASAYTYNANLTIGSTGADVSALQSFLVAQGKLVMPAGVNMGYFGNLTKTALAAYQATVGLPATGFFGPMTREKLNGSPASSDDNNSNVSVSGGDGDFKDYKVLGSPNSKDVNEGQTEKVFGVEFEAKKSDLKVERFSIGMSTSTGTSHAKPWKVLDSISLYNGSKKLATVDASDSSNWEEEANKEYSLDFEDLSSVVKEGTTAKFYIEVTAKDSVDAGDLGTMYIWVMNDGVRAVNGKGIDVYEGDHDSFADATGKKTFDLVSAGQDVTITVDSEDNEDQPIEVDDNNSTDDVVIYKATLKAEDGDININEATVGLTAAVSSVDDILSTVYLYVDGDEVGSESASASVSFDDLDIDVGEDEEKDIEVRVDVNDADQFDSGASVYVTSLAVDFTNAADDDITETSTDDGGIITFATDALAVTRVQPTTEYPAFDKVGNDESKGVFAILFKVSAPSEYDIYINNTASTTGGGTNNGAEYSFVSGSATKTVESLIRVSGGSDSNGMFKIVKGNSATFALQVELDNNGGASNQSIKLGLDAINYATNTTGTSTSTFTSGLDEDFQVGPKTLYTANLAD